MLYAEIIASIIVIFIASVYIYYDYKLRKKIEDKRIKIIKDVQKIKEEDSIRIVSNRIKTPDGTILISNHVHDYQTHIDKNGKEYMVDGGTQYLRRTVYEDAPFEELSIYSNAPFEVIRKSLLWGTYGKSGEDELKFVSLDSMSDVHISSIMHKRMCSKFYREQFVKELAYRKHNLLTIDD